MRPGKGSQYFDFVYHAIFRALAHHATIEHDDVSVLSRIRRLIAEVLKEAAESL
jgi:hypothetical protein